MTEVKLYTEAGSFVTTLVIPRFNPEPEVILWGSRVFTKTDDGDRYGEVFAYFVPVAP